MNIFSMQTRAGPGEGCVAASRPPPGGPSESLRRVAAALAAPGERLLKTLSLARRRRAAIRQLSRLSDRQLADIGISRPRIEDVVDGLFRRDGEARHG